MLMTLGGAMYKEVCLAHLILGGCGGMPPQENFKF